jgi:hypothetical protein
MVNELRDLQKNNKAAFTFLMELLTKGRNYNEIAVIRKFVELLLKKCQLKGSVVVDMNDIFHFILVDTILLIKPKPDFDGDDFLILPIQQSFDFEPELVRIDEKEFRTHPGFSVRRYLRLCVRRGNKEEGKKLGAKALGDRER